MAQVTLTQIIDRLPMLEPEELRQLNRNVQARLQPEERIKDLLSRWQAEENNSSELKVHCRPNETVTQALFREWNEVDALMTEDEKKSKTNLWDDIEASLLEPSEKLHLRQVGS